MPMFTRFGILLRFRRSHGPSSRPPGAGPPRVHEAEAGRHGGSGKRKGRGPPHVEKRAAKRESARNSSPETKTILGILSIILYQVPGTCTAEDT